MRPGTSISYLASLVDAEINGPDGPLPARFYADSRLVGAGDAFVAFRGEQHDGHDFIGDAVSRGASLIVCEDRKNVPAPVASIVVRDCFTEIPEMARRYQESFGDALEVVAVTGSVGKTTTREVIRACLAPSFKVHSAENSYNTLIGCSLSILAMPGDAEVLILEMGTNHPGEIANTVRFFPPTLSVITEIAPAHLEGLGSVEGVLEAKFEITGSQRLKKLLYFGDNSALASRCASMPSRIQALGVGFTKNDFTIRDVLFELVDGAPRLRFDLLHKEKCHRVVSSLFGRHSALAAAFGLAATVSLGGGVSSAISNIRSMEAPRGRGKFIRLLSGAVLLDDSYNANPASMRACLSEALMIPARRRIAALGEMRELGLEGLEYHKALLPLLNQFTRVCLTGGLWREVFGDEAACAGVEFFDGPNTFACEIRRTLGDGDLLVVKGSHGNRLDLLVDALTEDGAL